jgi:hypothetical protein
MNNIFAKNIGTLGERTILELLYIKQKDRNIDTSFTIHFGKKHGVGISFLCWRFLFEVYLFPLLRYTHYSYLND